MPINVVLVMLIAIISISLLIGLFMTKVPTFAKGIYCNTFFHLHSATFVPDAIRQDQSYCKLENNIDVFVLDNQTKVNESILAYVLACWDRADLGDRNKPLVCYEITVGQNDICDPSSGTFDAQECTVSEAELRQILENERLCDLIPVNDGTTECPTGTTEDNLDMGTLNIRTEQNYIVEYDGSIIRVY